jgi:competence protein ComEA
MVLGRDRSRNAVRQTPAPSPTPQGFPEGPGRELVIRICSDCHPTTRVTKEHQWRAKWAELVDKMVGEGAQVKDDDFDPIVSYLSVAFGKKIKINEAAAKDIADAFDIDLKLAEAIVKYRTDNGPFKEWKDLTKVKGLDPKRVEEQQGNLDFGTQRFQPPSATSESRSSR